jgi:hypothetical protein
MADSRSLDAPFARAKTNLFALAERWTVLFDRRFGTIPPPCHYRNNDRPTIGPLRQRPLQSPGSRRLPKAIWASKADTLEDTMTGRRTHEQQMRIIEKRENTKGAGKDFDAEADLKRSAAEREALRKGSEIRSKTPDLVDPDDRNILRGENQESVHHKNRPND